MNDIIKYKSNYSFKMIKLSKIWLVLIIIIILGIIFLNNNIYYKKYYKNTGIIIEKDLINMMVLTDDINTILNNKNIIINKERFAYKIEKIEKPIIVNGISYNEVVLNIKLDDNLNIINNTLDIKILTSEETILKYIIKKVKG